MAGDKWRLLGSVRRSLPSTASWLASPFFWVVKEEQFLSQRLEDLLYRKLYSDGDVMVAESGGGSGGGERGERPGETSTLLIYERT